MSIPLSFIPMANELVWPYSPTGVYSVKNALRTSDKPFPILRVLQDARSAQASYARSIPPKPPERGSLAPQHTGWTPPNNHMFKVNFDGAIFRKEQKAVEAFAANEALKFAKEFGLSAIVLEGDSKHTIDSLLCEDTSLADIGHLIEEAKMYGRQFDVI
nr:hypothetical protein CFP56_01896 [Quercus suber]